MHVHLRVRTGFFYTAFSRRATDHSTANPSSRVRARHRTASHWKASGAAGRQSDPRGWKLIHHRPGRCNRRREACS